MNDKSEKINDLVKKIDKLTEKQHKLTEKKNKLMKSAAPIKQGGGGSSTNSGSYFYSQAAHLPTLNRETLSGLDNTPMFNSFGNGSFATGHNGLIPTQEVMNAVPLHEKFVSGMPEYTNEGELYVNSSPQNKLMSDLESSAGLIEKDLMKQGQKAGDGSSPPPAASSGYLAKMKSGWSDVEAKMKSGWSAARTDTKNMDTDIMNKFNKSSSGSSGSSGTSGFVGSAGLYGSSETSGFMNSASSNTSKLSMQNMTLYENPIMPNNAEQYDNASQYYNASTQHSVMAQPHDVPFAMHKKAVAEHYDSPYFVKSDKYPQGIVENYSPNESAALQTKMAAAVKAQDNWKAVAATFPPTVSMMTDTSKSVNASFVNAPNASQVAPSQAKVLAEQYADVPELLEKYAARVAETKQDDVKKLAEQYADMQTTKKSTALMEKYADYVAKDKVSTKLLAEHYATNAMIKPSSAKKLMEHFVAQTVLKSTPAELHNVIQSTRPSMLKEKYESLNATSQDRAVALAHDHSNFAVTTNSKVAESLLEKFVDAATPTLQTAVALAEHYTTGTSAKDEVLADKYVKSAVLKTTPKTLAAVVAKFANIPTASAQQLAEKFASYVSHTPSDDKNKAEHFAGQVQTPLVKKLVQKYANATAENARGSELLEHYAAVSAASSMPQASMQTKEKFASEVLLNHYANGLVVKSTPSQIKSMVEKYVNIGTPAALHLAEKFMPHCVATKTDAVLLAEKYADVPEKALAEHYANLATSSKQELLQSVEKYANVKPHLAEIYADTFVAQATNQEVKQAVDMSRGKSKELFYEKLVDNTEKSKKLAEHYALEHSRAPTKLSDKLVEKYVNMVMTSGANSNSEVITKGKTMAEKYAGMATTKQSAPVLHLVEKFVNAVATATSGKVKPLVDHYASIGTPSTQLLAEKYSEALGNVGVAMIPHAQSPHAPNIASAKNYSSGFVGTPLPSSTSSTSSISSTSEGYETIDKAYHEAHFDTQSTMTEGFASAWKNAGGLGRR